MDWIVLAIKSVLNQTYQNFELILIDDSSTNDVLDKIKDLINSDDRILFIRNNENLKLTKTLNKGIGIAKGKYIARIDDDDIWNNEKKLEKQVQFLEKNTSY